VMLTGDHPAVAETVAKQLGISRYLADAFPEQKSDFIRSLQQEGRRVAVVTNGRTPSLALAQADVGIAIDSKADIAQKTVQVAMLEGDLWRIPQVIGIARESVQLLQQNWNLTFYLNTAALALALPGLLAPLGATLLNNGSAVLAVLNALQPLVTRERKHGGTSNPYNGAGKSAV
jgi:P-type E1-E2 ATPase